MSANAPVETRPADPFEAPPVRARGGVPPRPAEPKAGEPLTRKKERPRKGACRLAGGGPGGSAVIAKRCRRGEALLEQTIYEEVLPRLPLPALRCYGLVEEPDGQSAWLFLEDAGGERYSASLQEHR